MVASRATVQPGDFRARNISCFAISQAHPSWLLVIKLSASLQAYSSVLSPWTQYPESCLSILVGLMTPTYLSWLHLAICLWWFLIRNSTLPWLD